uniref:Uncharacterized protein n=1 Tax=Glossina palpalis gambiensis TaxID=67801 RepID=A0A1B0AWN2_9MUSC
MLDPSFLVKIAIQKKVFLLAFVYLLSSLLFWWNIVSVSVLVVSAFPDQHHRRCSCVKAWVNKYLLTSRDPTIHYRARKVLVCHIYHPNSYQHIPVHIPRDFSLHHQSSIEGEKIPLSPDK